MLPSDLGTLWLGDGGPVNETDFGRFLLLDEGAPFSIDDVCDPSFRGFNEPLACATVIRNVQPKSERFATNACYGMSLYRSSDELKAIWGALERILHRHSGFSDAIEARYEDEIRYFRGCARRGSSDVLVVS